MTYAMSDIKKVNNPKTNCSNNILLADGLGVTIVNIH